jgi:hypothetical protein
MRSSTNILIAAVLLSIGGCKLQPDAEDLLNDMVVVTNYNTTVDFNSFPTYIMPMDSVGLLENQKSPTWLTDSYATSITNAVRRNMTNTGRTMVSKSQSPSLAVNVYIVKDVETFQNVIYPSYYGYPGAGYGGYYGGYGGYGGYPQVVNYQSQTALLIIELEDLINVDATTKETRVLWTANIGDLINTYDGQKKTIEAIDQAFAQSEYLKK